MPFVAIRRSTGNRFRPCHFPDAKPGIFRFESHPVATRASLDTDIVRHHRTCAAKRAGLLIVWADRPGSDRPVLIMEERAFIENCNLGMIIAPPVIVSAEGNYGHKRKRE